jgi:CRISPR system Cascade subunit CasE
LRGAADVHQDTVGDGPGAAVSGTADWLVRKGAAGGFRLGGGDFRTVAEGTVLARKGGRPLSFHAVRFEGVLEVAEPGPFLQTLADGVGSGKGLGFGLLSVGPAGA